MTPTVSIILPTYNRLVYLRPAIESVELQTFTDWELIIADDGSDGDTAAYLKTLEAVPRMKVLWLAHTANPSAGRNAAIRAARGKYVAFLDSDDVWSADKLRLQLKAHEANAGRRWSYTALTRIDTNGIALPQETGLARRLCEGEIFEQLLKLEVAVATPTVMVERQLLEQAGGFDEQQLFFEDYDLWLRLSLLSEVTAIDRRLSSVRSHEQHYSADRIGVYQARHRLLGKLSARPGSPHLRSVLRLETAKNALCLARATAASGQRLQSLQMLWKSRSCAWHEAGWPGATGVILGLLLSPAWLRRALRKNRRALGAAVLG